MERILVRLPGWLGDLLMARPLLHALRRLHPGAAIEVVGEGAHLELLAAEGVFDRAHPWPPDAGARDALARTLRACPAEAAFVLPPSFSSAWFAWRSGARERIGYDHEMRGALLTRALRRRARGELHLSREYLALEEALDTVDGAPGGAGGRPAAPSLPLLALPRGAAALAEEALACHGVSRRPLAVLGPAARYGPAKRWSPSRFAAVGRVLLARGFGVLVCGGAGERDECAAVAAAAGEGAVTLAGTIALPAMAALCARAAIALCNDSGLGHLAAAAGAPTVVVFGSTSSAWTAPLGPRVRVIQEAPACAPCFRRTCRIGMRCLEGIGVERVLRACLEAAA